MRRMYRYLLGLGHGNIVCRELLVHNWDLTCAVAAILLEDEDGMERPKRSNKVKISKG